MRRPDLPIIGLLGIVLVGSVLLTRADRTGAPPVATRVVATITTIDRTTGLATLQTAQGARGYVMTCMLPAAAVSPRFVTVSEINGALGEYFTLKRAY